MSQQTTPPRWYVVSVDGRATLCKDAADAKMVEHECNLLYPRHGPHTAVLLAPVEEVQPHDAMLAPLIYAAIMHGDKRPRTVEEFERASERVADMLARRNAAPVEEMDAWSARMAAELQACPQCGTVDGHKLQCGERTDGQIKLQARGEA